MDKMFLLRMPPWQGICISTKYFLHLSSKFSGTRQWSFEGQSGTGNITAGFDTYILLLL